MSTSNDTPLWELQAALYTRLTANVTSAAVYDYIPDDANTRYVLMISEEVVGIQDKSGSVQRVEAQLMCFVVAKDSKELKGIVDEVLTAMNTPLTLTTWKTMNQVQLPTIKTYRARTHTGIEGRAADVVYQFLFQK